MLDFDSVKEFLEEKAAWYNRPEFIDTDPIQIPHQYDDPGDIEISGFFAATLAWGQRKTTISKVRSILSLMEHAPYKFILEAGEDDLRIFHSFVHRTFNGSDCVYFVEALRNIYHNHGGLERVFTGAYEATGNIHESLVQFRKVFTEIRDPGHAGKHIPDVSRGSSAKRMNLFLRWMVRNDQRGVDFGLWKRIAVSSLMIPLDVHTSSVARKLGLLKRKQNDWKAVEELTAGLRRLDPADPVRFDYALFGLGIFEKF